MGAVKAGTPVAVMAVGGARLPHVVFFFTTFVLVLADLADVAARYSFLNLPRVGDDLCFTILVATTAAIAEAATPMPATEAEASTEAAAAEPSALVDAREASTEAAGLMAAAEPSALVDAALAALALALALALAPEAEAPAFLATALDLAFPAVLDVRTICKFEPQRLTVQDKR